jgi:hypothetical protein
MSVRGVAVLAGPVVPVPIDTDAADALERVEIITAIGERGSFRLRFRLDTASDLPDRFLSSSGDLVRTVITTIDDPVRVVMDGLLVEHTLATGPEGGPLTLELSGEDLTLVMDLVEASGRTFAGVPVPARVQTLLAAYALFGITPQVVPPVIASVPGPSDIPHQQGSDYQYVRRLAERVGYRFTLDPGPIPGASLAYWGPEPRGGAPTPSLVIDLSQPEAVTGLRLRFEALHRVTPEAIVLDSSTKTAIPIPVPAITALAAPLGRVVPPAHRRRRLHETAKLTPADAAARLLAIAARSAEAMSGHGSHEVTPDRERLRVGQIVELRGAGDAFGGLYLVSRVHDVITHAHHRQQFELLRAGLGARE